MISIALNILISNYSLNDIREQITNIINIYFVVVIFAWVFQLDRQMLKSFEKNPPKQLPVPDKNNIELTHALDALSYAIEYRFPIRQIARSVKW